MLVLHFKFRYASLIKSFELTMALCEFVMLMETATEEASLVTELTFINELLTMMYWL